MAVDDVIVRSGPVAVPLDYKVPTGTEIIPRVISATLDGTGAAGPFLAVLEVIAPNGTITAYCLKQIQIAAGASASVSWFPGGGVDDDQTVDVDTGGTISTLTSTGGTLTVNTPSGPTTNVDMPATGVAAGSYGDASDAVTIVVDAQGRITSATSVPIAGGGAVVASDGWVPDTTETWTFASFAAGPPAVGTFTVPGDLRAKYTVGTRIRLVQTTTKYFVVTADPTYDGVKTTVTISGGTDYTLANAAISANYHSYVVNPQGYPGYFNFSSTWVGFTAAPTVTRSYFAVVGRTCYVGTTVTGTSNATSMTATAPVPGYSTTLVSGVALGRVTDNGVNVQGIVAVVNPSNTLITFGVGVTPGASFTNAGTKGAITDFFYRI